MAFSAGIVRRILNNAASPSSPLHASVQKLVCMKCLNIEINCDVIVAIFNFKLTTVSSADKPVDTRVALYVHIQYRYIHYVILL